MPRATAGAACAAIALLAGLFTACGGDEGVGRFAAVPVGFPGHIEGMTADRDGNIYAASLEIPELTPLLPAQEAKKDEMPSPNFVYVWDSRGRLTVSMPMPAGRHESHPWVVPAGILAVDDTLYVLDLMNGDVLEYRLPLAATSEPSAVHAVCGGLVVRFGVTEAGHFCSMNDITLGPDGHLYISDTGSAAVPAGRVIRLTRGGDVSVFFGPDLGEAEPSEEALNVDPERFPTFGANGLAFGAEGFGGAAGERFLFIANMSTARIWKLPVALEGGEMRITGAATLFAEGPDIDGPDDLVFDDRGRLWVVSGQKNQAVELDSAGRVVRTVGKYDGVTEDGDPKELLQPSSIVFSDGYLYVGNEASRNFLPEDFPVDWDSLQTFTIARFKP